MLLCMVAVEDVASCVGPAGGRSDEDHREHGGREGEEAGGGEAPRH
jgi:hypothetical protein